MSDKRTLKKKDLHTPLNNEAILKVMAHIDPIVSKQVTAADNTDTFIVTRAGKFQAAFVVLDRGFEAAEAMTIDIQKNGVSILTGATPLDISDKAANSMTDFTPLATTPMFEVGDSVTIIRNWTTGGGVDTTPATVVKLLWA